MTARSSDETSTGYQPIEIALGIFVAAISMVLMGVQPILIGLFSDHLHLDLNQSGWVLAAEQFGGAAGALGGFWVAARFRWTYTIAGAFALAAAVNILSAYAAGYAELAATRFISGFTTTVVYTVAVYFLGHASKPDRTFGILMVLTTTGFSVDAILVPTLNEHFGYASAVGSAAIWFGVALVAGMFLPAASGRGSTDPSIRNLQARPLVGIAALVGAFLMEVSIFAVWGFLERVGRLDSLSDEQVGYGIGIGVLGGIPGGLLPAMLGVRLGRISMIALSASMLVASYVALGTNLHMTGYVLWITLLNFGWVLGLTYYMGLTVREDPDGRYTRLIPFSQMFAAGVGPACSALIIKNDELSPIFVVASVAATAGLIAVLLADRLAAARHWVEREA